MMATLARLKMETERLEAQKSRKVFVSSSPVQAFRVANDRKERLSHDDPLILAMPHDATSGVGSLMIDASVGPELEWTLTGINHVLRTVSKWGEPTYLFAGIVDTDPKAFVAVTLDKRTPPEEVAHLESVLGRVSQLHIAEKRPAQLPGADQVLKGLGKGIKALMVLGGSSSSKQQEQQRDEGQQRDAEQQQERERAAYLAARGGGGGAPHVAVHGRPVGPEDVRPSASTLFGSSDRRGPSSSRAGSQGPALGVRSRADADDRLAQLKADLAQEGQPPSAPDVQATPAETTHYQQQQQQRRQQQAYRSDSDTDTDEWVIYQPTSYQQQQAGRYNTPAGPDRHSQQPTAAGGGHYYPSVPGAYGGGFDTGAVTTDRNRDRDSSGQQQQARDARPSYDYRNYDPAGGVLQGGVAYDTTTTQAATGMAGGAVKPAWGQAGGVTAATASELQQEAQRAREEWEQAQRKAEEAAAAAAQRAQRERDGGWGDSSGKVAQQARQRQQEKQQPDWVDLLGKVFGGGPAYSYAAPDL